MLKNFRRLGVWVINISIVGMFYQVLIIPLAIYLSFTLESLIIDMMIIVIYIILWIGIYMLYQWVSFNLIHKTIAHKLLSMEVLTKKNKELTKSVYLKREYYKVSLLFATFGLYFIYCLILVMLLNKETPHDKKFGTKVVPLKY